LIVQALITNILQEKIMMQNLNYALFFLLALYVKKKLYNLSHEKGKYVPFHKGKQMTNMKNEPTRKPLACFYYKKTNHIIKHCHARIVAKTQVKC
jgi:hypothetical protein